MIDNTPIEDIIRIGEGGAYERIGVPPEKTERFVCYLISAYEGAESEEIDVNATDDTDAQIICTLAILWHYEEGLVISRIKHIPKGMMYL